MTVSKVERDQTNETNEDNVDLHLPTTDSTPTTMRPSEVFDTVTHDLVRLLVSTGATFMSQSTMTHRTYTREKNAQHTRMNLVTIE